MDLATSELISRIRSLSPAQLSLLDVEEVASIDRALRDVKHDRLEARCASDPLYWAQNWTATENSHYIEQGLPFTAPFPTKSYFEPLFRAFRSEKRLFIPKTREMLTSWAVMVYATHRAQWEKAEVVVQTESETKAHRLVEYAAILYRNQADWLRARHPLTSATALSNEWADGGKIFGIPSGETKIRIFHPTIYVMDEASFLPEAEACYNAANPVAQQIIAISSAGPGWFGDICSR
jgi:hypothetical protein